MVDECKMTTLKELQKFFMSHNLIPGTQIALTLDEYTKVVEESKNLHGKLFGQILMDCFMPVDEPIEPGYEDSLASYVFLCDTWFDVGIAFAPVIEPR